MKRFEGQIEKVSPVSKNRVQFSIYGIPGLFELFIDQSWVMEKDDEVVAFGQRDETGKTCCYAYANISKGICGWKYIEHEDFMAGILGSVIGVFLYVCFLGGVFSDGRYFLGIFLLVVGCYVFNLFVWKGFVHSLILRLKIKDLVVEIINDGAG